MNTKTLIVVVTLNHAKYIIKCVKSVLDQTDPDFELLVIDNNSDDRTVELVENFASQNKRIHLIKNEKNLGFSAANNHGIRLAQGKYILCLNPDAILENDFLRKGVKFFQNHEKAGAIAAKILKYDFDQDKKLSQFDSAGIMILKNRRTFDRFQSEPDLKKYNQTEEVFGASGACAFFKKEALENVKISDEYFDEDFFAYKEDNDLSWRLRLYGWQIWYYPACLAYHGRGTGVIAVQDRTNFWKIMKHRREEVPRLTRALSYRNQRLTQIKNEFLIGWLSHFPLILLNEVASLIYIIILEPYILKGFFEIFKYLPKMLKKRKIITRNKKITWKELAKWFN